MREFALTSFDGLAIFCTEFDLKNPKAVVQIIHGAKEHRKRYYDFATFLNQHGYAVLLSDNRGHGEGVNEEYPLGFMPDYQNIIEDQILITKYIKEKYHDSKIYLMGHSFGSMLARIYLEEHDEMIDKLVLSGTANYQPLGIIGILTGKFFQFFRGCHGYSRLLERFANFLDDSWVVKNQEALEKYRQDPYCTYPYPIASMISIFSINRELAKVKHFKCHNPQLPILTISGELDPVTGYEKGLGSSIHFLKKVGYKNISKKVYANMAHEVLNELEHQMVYEDILAFFEKS
jgi:alpha-beta hydrolase superfamily lysophospholipase